ncbi:MAG: hypothetical protein IKL18_09355 [Oscillospiraceae bacterium]|nr:hypothetical protein [Oscillospiraceae bacterium]
MKKIICFALVFIMLFSGCSKWNVEIVDPTEPSKSEAEKLTEEKEPEFVSKEEEKEPRISSFYRMKISEGEAISEDDMLNLRDDEIKELSIIFQQPHWIEAPENFIVTGELISPVNMLESPAKNGTIYISSAEGQTLIIIKWGKVWEHQKIYFAPEEVAFEIEEFRKELEEKAILAEDEPKVENYCKILLYSDDENYMYQKFSDEELSEWLSILKPEAWEEDTSERTGSISFEIQLSSDFGTAMYMGFDFENEVALVKWGKNDNLSKVYILPKGTIEAAKKFKEKMYNEYLDIFKFPERNYDLSAKAFLNRENDDYIFFLDELMMCCRWGEGIDFKGFESSEELNSKTFFNIFMYIFDLCGAGQENNLAKLEWYQSADERYHIPMTDIYTILNKYFDNFHLNMEEISVNYEFDEETDTIAIYGGYGIINYRGEDRNVVSVTDNGDGTITTIVEEYVYHMDDNDNMILSEKPEIRKIMVLRPENSRCVIESLKIENIGD